MQFRDKITAFMNTVSKTTFPKHNKLHAAPQHEPLYKRPVSAPQQPDYEVMHDTETRTVWYRVAQIFQTSISHLKF
jgi:hypothetical protein